MDTAVLGTIGEDGVDSQWLEELVLGLRRDLLAGDVATVRQVHEGEAPAGSRAIEAVAAVCAWLGRGQVSRTVNLTVSGSTLRLSAATEERQRLVDAFVAVGRTGAR